MAHQQTAQFLTVSAWQPTGPRQHLVTVTHAVLNPTGQFGVGAQTPTDKSATELIQPAHLLYRLVPPQTGPLSQPRKAPDNTCAIKTDNTLWCWGINTTGQLGIGDTTDRNTPAQVGVATNWRTVSAGNSFTCGIKTDNTLWCWGSNANGRTGLNTSTGNTLTPTQVGSGTTWAKVFVGATHSCATKSDGTLWCWGSNANGRTGQNTSTGNLLVPTQVGVGTTWASGSSSNTNTCAVKTDATLWCWGWNFYGQIGVGDTSDRLVPTQVGSSTNWSTAASGTSYTCATKLDSTLWCWGTGAFFQLGYTQNPLLWSPHVLASSNVFGRSGGAA